MKFACILFITACAVYITVGNNEIQQAAEKNVDHTRQKRVDEKVNDIFRSENQAKDFIKDKRAPSSGYRFRKHRYYGGNRRRYKYGHHGGYRGGYRYGFHGGGGESEEMEEGEWYGR